LIPRESAEALSTDRRVTCSIEEIPAAALIAIRCRTPSVPTDPIAMNTARIPSSASMTSRESSSCVGRTCRPSGSPKALRASSRSPNQYRNRVAALEEAADDLAADVAGGADHCGGHRVSFR